MSAPNTDAGMLRPGVSFSASDLIDPTSLPSWMQPNAPSANAATPGVPPQVLSTHSYAGTPPQAFSASDLIDRQSLPDWMRGQGQAQQPQQPQRLQQSQQPQQPQQPDKAVWQGGSTSYAAPAPGGPGGDNGQPSGLAASSLLDMNALPSWLRNGQQASGYANPGGQGGQPVNNSMAAGSLIDMNALPAWLRTADSQPQGAAGGATSMSPAQYGNGTQGRIESMRVPSRPRAEMIPPEQSEVAANVFSSMLGVASTTPYYPDYPASAARQQNFQNAPAQPSGAMFPAQPAAASVFNSGPGVPAQGIAPGASGDFYQGVYPNAQNPYGAYPGANQAQQAQNGGIQPGTFNTAQGVPASQSGAKAGKRSFFDTIREWFHL